MSAIKTNPYTNDKMFGALWLMFFRIDSQITWQATGTHEKDQKVYVTWKKQTHAIGFAHELCILPKEKLMALLDIYFGEDK